MGVEASPQLQAASDAALGSLEAVNELLGAPLGWNKKLAPRKGGTLKTIEAVFVAPNGEEIKSKHQLERYLKANPGGPSLTDFDWSTGKTPRRSERLNTKLRKSTDSTETDSPARKSKKKMPATKSEEDIMIETSIFEKEPSVKEYKEDEAAETTPVEEFQKDEDTDLTSKRSETVSMKEFREEEVTVTKIAIHRPVMDAKEGKVIRTNESGIKLPLEVIEQDKDTEMKEAILSTKNSEEAACLKEEEFKRTKENIVKADPDTEMKNVSPVTETVGGGAGIIKEDMKPMDESSGEYKKGINCNHKMEQNTDVEAPVVSVFEADPNGTLTEINKNVYLNGQQAAPDEIFSTKKSYVEHEEAETVYVKSDLEKPEIAPYFGVTKPQEPHPTEVGVNS